MAIAKKPAAKKPAAKKPAANKAAAKKPPAAKAAAKPAAKKAKKIAIKATCFTIMPFGNWFDDYYDSIYAPAIKASNLHPKRADDLYRPSAIVHDIWALTQEAKIILADLSGKNPNVFYELGLAHALAKPAILVTESLDDIPFDLRALRVLVYDKNEPNWGQLLKQKIESAIKEIIESPLEAVLPTFLKIEKSSTKKVISKEEKELISVKQDLDLIKRQIEIGVRSRRIPRSRRPRINNQEEAVEFAKRYLVSDRFSREDIIDALLEEGVPERRYALEAVKEAERDLR